MKFYGRVEVIIKRQITDPEADTTLEALRKLGYGEVGGVRCSKVYHIHLETASKQDARNRLEEMAQRLLTNPTRDDYEIFLKEE